MMIKQISLTQIQKAALVGILTASLFMVPSVFAQTVAPTPNPTRAARQAARLDAASTRLKTRATTEITRRTTSLNALITRINNVKHLTSDQKSNLASQIQTEITTLTALGTKIAGDTDVTTLRTDVKAIVDDNRVYLLFIPKMTIISHGDQIIDVANELTSLNAPLQSLIDSAKAAGKNVDAVTASMTDRTAKIADAINQANNAINSVIPLTPDGYPGNKTTLESARTMLATGRTDLRTAYTDGRSIRTAIKGMGVKTPTPTPTP